MDHLGAARLDLGRHLRQGQRQRSARDFRQPRRGAIGHGFPDRRLAVTGNLDAHFARNAKTSRHNDELNSFSAAATEDNEIKPAPWKYCARRRPVFCWVACPTWCRPLASAIWMASISNF